MIKNLLQLYSLLSCLIYALVCLISGGLLLNQTTVYVFPEIKYNYHSRYFNSNHDFIESHKDREALYKELVKKSDEEITELRLREKTQLEERQIEESRRNAKESIIFESEWFLLSLLFFGLHWRLYRKSLKQA